MSTIKPRRSNKFKQSIAADGKFPTDDQLFMARTSNISKENNSTSMKSLTIDGKEYTPEELFKKFPFPKDSPVSMWGTPYGHFRFYKEFGGTLDSVET